MAEVKLELAMLWATLNSIQNKSNERQISQRTNTKVAPTQVQSPFVKSTGTETLDFSVRPTRNSSPESSIDCKHLLNSYRTTHKEKFESQKTRRNQVKTSKKSKGNENKVSDLKQKIKKVEQERESLKTIIQIQKEEFRQALSTKENNESQIPWQFFKPKQTINPKSKSAGINVEKQTRKSGPISTSNQYVSLEDEIVNVNELTKEISEATNVIVQEHNKETESLNKLKKTNDNKKNETTPNQISRRQIMQPW